MEKVAVYVVVASQYDAIAGDTETFCEVFNTHEKAVLFLDTLDPTMTADIFIREVI